VNFHNGWRVPRKGRRMDKIFTKQEAELFFANDPILYTEKAHDYPCCNVPIEENCKKCNLQCGQACYVHSI